jgi:hypothetical protein
MNENLSDVEVSILDLWYELGINTLIDEGVIFQRLRTKFSREVIDYGIHKLKKDMISGKPSNLDPTKTMYSLTDEQGKPYIKEIHRL